LKSRYVIGQYLTTDPEVSEFAELLKSANLLDVRFRDPITREVIPNLKFFAGAKYWTGFIPTNDAMAKAREEGIIPATYPKTTEGRDSINTFLMYHFIKNDVVFDDGQKSGEFNTNHTYRAEDGTTLLNTKIQITNLPNSLTIHDRTGQNVVVDHANAGILVRKGVCHKINTVLKYYE
jgi:uncharacterized surface protein with fasciclin (FAS1) repeats